jgi:hypothetical protein
MWKVRSKPFTIKETTSEKAWREKKKSQYFGKTRSSIIWVCKIPGKKTLKKVDEKSS